MSNIDVCSVCVSGGINDPVHRGDAGHDLVAIGPPKIIGSKINDRYYSRILFIEYDTGVVVEPSSDIFSLVYPRSSITAKTNLLLGNSIGLIDTGYRGNIKLRFRYIPQPEDFVIIDGLLYFEINQERIYQKGDRIAQLVFAKHVTTSLERVIIDTISSTKRGAGGFGSTG